MRVNEAALQSGDNSERISVEWRLVTGCTALEPIMMEFQPQHVEAVEAEWMDVAVTEASPVAELDSELVSGIGGANEIALVDLEESVEQVDLRYRGLADADGADLVQFDELNSEIGHGPHDLRNGGCGHPTCGATADDHDLVDSICSQRTNSAGGIAAFD